MNRRSFIVVATGLIAAALMAGYFIAHGKTTRRNGEVEPRRAGDPWASSPWVARSQHGASVVSTRSANARPAQLKPSQSDTVAPSTAISRVGQATAIGEISDVASAENGNNALNVKWPPLASVSPSAAGRKPRGWGLFSTAYAAAHCRFSADDSYVHAGQYSALLQYDGADPKLRCFVGQVSQAGAFAGNRVQFSAFMAGRDVVDGAGLIFRADDAEGNIVAYNFTGQGTFKGSQPWGYDVVIVDVPDTAAKLYYGAWLGLGGGSLWVDTVEFHIVDKSFPVTHPPPTQSRKSGAPAFQPPPVPSNLDFEDTDPIR
jgi:hypothetical protein